MRKLALAGCIVALALLGVQEFGCGPKVGPCGADYNCPEGFFCVAGACVDVAPPRPEPKPEPTKPDGGDEPKPEPKPEPQPEPTSNTCSSSSDCNDDANPVCFQTKCIKGFATFNFGQGDTPITDPAAGTIRCTNNNQCKSWQGCSQGFCRNRIQQSSSAKGKYLDEGISLTDYSTAAFTNEDGTPTIQIIMLTNFSDRLDKMIRIDIPVSMMKTGKIDIDGTKVKAGFYDIYSEFQPARTISVGMATGGSVTFTKAGTKPGDSVQGNAVLIFQ